MPTNVTTTHICPTLHRVAGKVRSLKRHANGKMHLQFHGTPGQVYILEAATNLVDWERAGLATVNEHGAREFEDAQAPSSPAGFTGWGWRRRNSISEPRSQ